VFGFSFVSLISDDEHVLVDGTRKTCGRSRSKGARPGPGGTSARREGRRASAAPARRRRVIHGHAPPAKYVHALGWSALSLDRGLRGSTKGDVAVLTPPRTLAEDRTSGRGGETS
jgi:hypothetical protein